MKGSHIVYRHSDHERIIIIAHGGKLSRDIPEGTNNTIFRLAGLRETVLLKAPHEIHLRHRTSQGRQLLRLRPDLPGCTTSAQTLSELSTNIKDAVDSYMEILKEDGLTIPTPTVSVAEVEAG